MHIAKVIERKIQIVDSAHVFAVMLIVSSTPVVNKNFKVPKPKKLRLDSIKIIPAIENEKYIHICE